MILLVTSSEALGRDEK